MSFQTTENEELDPNGDNNPNLVLFNCALNTFSKLNDLAFSSMTFETMQKIFNIQPDEFSYNALLNSCTDIESAMNIFTEMMKNEEIEANTETFKR